MLVYVAVMALPSAAGDHCLEAMALWHVSVVRVGDRFFVRGHEMLKDGAKVQVAGAGAAGNGGKQPGAAGECRVKQEQAQ